MKKFRDYLIIPALVMYLVYTSCAYVAGKGGGNSSAIECPAASICPSNISWGEECGDNWYAGGARGSEYFTVNTDSINAETICFHSGKTGNKGAECRYTVSDMHLKCSSDGQKHDIIFLNELTAYDCSSGTYYQRGDYEVLTDMLTSGRFVNSENARDYFVFKENGKSSEYFGNKVFKGKWSVETADSISVYDNECGEYFHFSIEYDGCGNISGIRYNNTIYEMNI